MKFQLATNLSDATRDFKASPTPQQQSAPTSQHDATSRDREVREFERHITDWQRRRYFTLS